jgi:GntR family transcriptional regulator, transcriptional repressor for pyruvate dehydrogenase complex
VPSERELMQSFKAGRSSVREALRMLESRGMIVPGRSGTFVVAAVGNVLRSSLSFVFDADDATFEDLFELRRALESDAAYLAAARRSDEHLERMRDALNAMERAIAEESSEAFRSSDLAMHRIVAEAAANPLILRNIEAARDLMNRALGSLYLIPNRAERTLEQLRALLHAIESQQPDTARDEMKRHVESVQRDVAKLTRRE